MRGSDFSGRRCSRVLDVARRRSGGSSDADRVDVREKIIQSTLLFLSNSPRKFLTAAANAFFTAMLISVVKPNSCTRT